MSMSTGACHGCGGCQGTCHQCSACHYNYNGLYGCQGGSILGVRSCATPTLMSPSDSQAMSEFPQYPHYAGIGTLPAHRIQDTSNLCHPHSHEPLRQPGDDGVSSIPTLHRHRYITSSSNP